MADEDEGYETYSEEDLSDSDDGGNSNKKNVKMRDWRISVEF